MQVRTAILTGVTGLMLTLGVGDAAFAQSADRYRDQSEDRYRDQSEYRYRDQSEDGYRDRSDSRQGRSGRAWRAEQIVSQAYRDILRREPDRSGLRQYTNSMLHDDWSERDVRRSLQRSEEYAQKFGRGRGRRSDR
jgi:hypothetical protein